MATRLTEKKYLSARGLLRIVGESFKKVEEPRRGTQGVAPEISLRDCLVSGLALFKLKFPSLLQFDQSRGEETIRQNLETLFRVRNVPSDTYLRERLDPVSPEDLRPAFKKVFSSLQRGKVLERYAFLDGHYLVAADGTGYFSSKEIHCKNCCEKNHRDGTKTYYHQMLAATIVHPDRREVIPLCPEPILKGDGAKKNDCERNAAARFIPKLRTEHPHLPMIFTEDALGANAPHIRLLQEHNIRYIIVVKPDSNKALFEWLEGVERGALAWTTDDGITHRVEYLNGIPLNDANPDLEVNFFGYWAYRDGQQIYHNTWITDFTIDNDNAYRLVQGGRAKWKIENETFNTLKNQGYQFEHNFGHGKENLTTIFALLMMLAFLIDQTEQMCCHLFQAARENAGSKVRLWDLIRGAILWLHLDSWATLYERVTNKGRCRSRTPALDTS